MADMPVYMTTVGAVYVTTLAGYRWPFVRLCGGDPRPGYTCVALLPEWRAAEIPDEYLCDWLGDDYAEACARRDVHGFPL